MSTLNIWAYTKKNCKDSIGRTTFSMDRKTGETAVNSLPRFLALSGICQQPFKVHFERSGPFADVQLGNTVCEQSDNRNKKLFQRLKKFLAHTPFTSYPSKSCSPFAYHSTTVVEKTQYSFLYQGLWKHGLFFNAKKRMLVTSPF